MCVRYEKIKILCSFKQVFEEKKHKRIKYEIIIYER